MQRRTFLRHSLAGCAGLGLLAAPHLLAGTTHHAPRVKRIIQLFMNGGASQCDLFDYKPLLTKRHGQAFNPGEGFRVEAATSAPGKVLAPPFPMRQRGASGRWVSDLLPHTTRHVDEFAFLMAMKSRTNVHGPASYLMNTGFVLPGFPCMGAWVSYALGRLADNLPTFVVLPDPRGLPYNATGNFGAGFLPVQHQGTIIEQNRIPFLERPSDSPPDAERHGLALLGELDRSFAARDAEDSRLSARVEAYALAARMQLAAPEALDLSRETSRTQAMYGIGDKATDDFGRRCLTARRLIERGVRFVQVWSGAGGPSNNWDNHNSMVKELPPMCAATDRPTAALFADLKQRGLLDDTLLIWSTEFGRMPFAQGGEGRDHNGGTFVGWMAGAGIKGGVAHGESDEWSWKASKDVCTTYDFHATVLHLLGLDHEKLSVRHDGADRRLTDVHGHVIEAILR
jgi:hypothetical protein